MIGALVNTYSNYIIAYLVLEIKKLDSFTLSRAFLKSSFFILNQFFIFSTTNTNNFIIVIFSKL